MVAKCSNALRLGDPGPAFITVTPLDGPFEVSKFVIWKFFIHLLEMISSGLLYFYLLAIKLIGKF